MRSGITLKLKIYFTENPYLKSFTAKLLRCDPFRNLVGFYRDFFLENNLKTFNTTFIILVMGGEGERQYSFNYVRTLTTNNRKGPRKNW